MKKESVCFYRVIPIVCMVGITLLLSLLFILLNHLMLDESICVGFIDVGFLSVFIYELEAERKKYMLSANRGTTFGFVAAGFCLSGLLLIGFLFLPDFCRPFALITLIMYTVSNAQLALITTVYFNILFAVTCSGNFFELVASLLLALFCSMLAGGLDSKKTRLSSAVLLLCTSLFTPLIFSYLAEGTISATLVAVNGILSIVMLLSALFAYEKIRKRVQLEYTHKLEDILDESYSFHHEFQKYYPADYRHACKVSEIAALCAKALGYSELLCAAGGLYYRIGKCLGGPHTAAAVKKAQSLCFPNELTQILAEYYGEKELPSTPESALVYTVDALVFKVEALQKEVSGSTWNREMIIYQAMNEFSSKGMYDRSGLSMNQFLKLREYLVREELWQ